jgi:hypothetical protein
MVKKDLLKIIAEHFIPSHLTYQSINSKFGICLKIQTPQAHDWLMITLLHKLRSLIKAHFGALTLHNFQKQLSSFSRFSFGITRLII